MVLDLLANNPVITQPKIALQPGNSQRKVNRIIAKLRELGMLFREGSNKTGRWIVKKQPRTPVNIKPLPHSQGNGLNIIAESRFVTIRIRSFYKWLIPSEFYSTAPRVVIILYIKHCWIAIAVESPNVVGGIGVIFIYFRVRNS